MNEYYVWVLTWRLELEENSNQTEEVNVEVFWDRGDAIMCARKVLSKQLRRWEYGPEDTVEEEVKLNVALGDRELLRRASHLVQLTDSDNLVFELTKKKVK